MVDFTYFTKTERTGTLVFIGALVILFGCLHIWSAKQVERVPTNEKIAMVLVKDSTEIREAFSRKPTSLTPRPVNPNTAIYDELIAIGLTNYAATSLINYRKTGARFYNSEDVSQVYGMDSTLLVKVLPWLQFEEKPIAKASSRRLSQSQKSKFPPGPVQGIDPNSATFKEFIDFGLSKLAATSLVNYRKTGAYFKKLDDLYNIYGIDSTYLLKHQKLISFTSVQDSPKAVISPNNGKPISKQKGSHPIKPNTATKAEFESIGLSSRSAATLINFRNSGARFYNKKDIMKVYGITDSVYLEIEALLDFDEKVESPTSEEPTTILNLNTVTEQDLLAINGIGEYLSKAIIEYKDALGGYRDISQLAEVPGLRPENYEKIKSNFIVEGDITKFHPLTLEFKELLKHPYVDYETAKIIKSISVNDYQERIRELMERREIDERLIPYLIQ